MNMFIVAGLLLVGVPLVFLYFRKELFAAGLFLLGLIVVGDSLWAARYEKALAASGVKALAAHTGESYTEVTELRSGTKRYKTDISFTTASGEVIAETAEIPLEALEKFKHGKPAQLTYLPDKPRYYRFDPWTPYAQQDIVFGLVVMGIGAVWVAVSRVRAARKAKAAA